jgi:ketosteroid isomerase-like protein
MIINKYYDAWNTMKPANAGIFYAKEGDLIFYDIAPLQYKGWQEYKTGVEKLFANYQSIRLIPNNDLVVNHRGRMAWTTLTFRLIGKDKQGQAMELDSRHTAIWERRGGKWLIVHEHLSTPLPDTTAQNK